jgi:choline dehydrogenase-like flavoprotein
MVTAADHADVVVVGSGAGGSTIAGEALRAGRSVILIEAGGAAPGRPGRHLRNDAPEEDRLDEHAERLAVELVYHSGAETGIGAIPGALTAHSLGGRMRAWFNNCPTPDAAERNAAIPDDAWPGLLGRASRLLHVSQEIGSASLRETRLLARLRAFLPDVPAGREVQPMPIAAARESGRVRFAGADDLLLGDVDELPASAHVMTDAVARRIVHSGGVVTGIEAYPRAGGSGRTVTGDVYVIAGGTLATPQLLVASELECSDALGRYVMDHVMLASRVPIARDLLAGVPDDDPSFAICVPYSSERPWHTQLSRTPALPNFLDCRPRDTGDLLTFCGVEPRPENRLTYDKNRLDGFGLPSLGAEFELSEGDRRLVGDAIRDHWMIASEFGEYHRGWAPQLSAFGTSTHLMGGHRMGAEDDGTSVTDSFSKVWGYDNLYLAGNGLFSERNGSSPTLQTVAMALRAADRILERAPEPALESGVTAG